MYKNLIIIILNLIFLQAGICQNDEIIFYNSQVIDESRYQDIKGSPYLFAEWKYGNIVDNNGKTYEDVMLNFNGYTHEFEARHKDKYIRLDEKRYIQVTVQEVGADSIVFRRGLHMDIFDQFVQVLYQGKRVKFIKKFTVELAKNSVQNASGRADFKRFVPQTQYYTIIDYKMEFIPLKKKKIMDQLGHEKQIEAFAKAQKIKIDTEAGLRQLLLYFEKEILP